MNKTNATLSGVGGKQKQNTKTTTKKTNHTGQRKMNWGEMFGCQKHPRVVACK